MLKAGNFTPVGSFAFILIIFLTLKLHSAKDQKKIPELVVQSSWLNLILEMKKMSYSLYGLWEQESSIHVNKRGKILY